MARVSPSRARDPPSPRRLPPHSYPQWRGDRYFQLVRLFGPKRLLEPSLSPLGSLLGGLSLGTLGDHLRLLGSFLDAARKRLWTAPIGSRRFQEGTVRLKVWGSAVHAWSAPGGCIPSPQNPRPLLESLGNALSKTRPGFSKLATPIFKTVHRHFRNHSFRQIKPIFKTGFSKPQGPRGPPQVHRSWAAWDSSVLLLLRALGPPPGAPCVDTNDWGILVTSGHPAVGYIELPRVTLGFQGGYSPSVPWGALVYPGEPQI